MILCKLVCGRMKIITFGTHVVVSAEAARAVSSIGFDFFRWVQPLRAPAARFEKNYEAKRGACAEPCCGSSLLGKTGLPRRFYYEIGKFHPGNGQWLHFWQLFGCPTGLRHVCAVLGRSRPRTRGPQGACTLCCHKLDPVS